MCKSSGAGGFDFGGAPELTLSSWSGFLRLRRRLPSAASLCARCCCAAAAAVAAAVSLAFFACASSVSSLAVTSLAKKYAEQARLTAVPTSAPPSTSASCALLELELADALDELSPEPTPEPPEPPEEEEVWLLSAVVAVVINGASTPRLRPREYVDSIEVDCGMDAICTYASDVRRLRKRR